MPNVGNIEPFHTSGLQWDIYEDCLRHYLIAQDVKEVRKISTVLSIIGGKTYAVLRNLMLPDSPASKSLEEIFGVLRKHFCPQPSTVAERYRFFRRFQKEGESFSDFVADLRQMTQFCKWFGPVLEENICNQFIVGLRNDNIRQTLFREMDVTLEQALKIANSHELSMRDAKEINPTSNYDNFQQVSKFTANAECNRSHKPTQSRFPGVQGKKCLHCGESSHISQDCKFFKAKCFLCNEKGHIKKCCPNKKVTVPSANSSKKGYRKKIGHTKNITTANDLVLSDLDHVTVCEVKVLKVDDPFMLTLSMDKQEVEMEIDSGAAVSILPDFLFYKLFPGKKLDSSEIILRSFTGEKEHPVGKFKTTVQFQGKTFVDLDIYVVKQVRTPLIGRSWINKLNLMNLFNALPVKATDAVLLNDKLDQNRLKILLSKYNKLFDGSLGKIVGIKAHFSVKEGSIPKFFKARPIPFAIKHSVEAELIRLEESGIISPIKFSEWAAPVVPIVKRDHSIRLCGDYKVGLNPALNVDSYPLPRIEDMFAQLSGGVVFTKLDLAQAYLQMELDEETKHFATINTIRGLFQVNRLPFGVASAPALFQKAMEQILSDLKGVICYLDDILITGSTLAEHFNNLEAVFERLQKFGIRLNQNKCDFLKTSVEYLGHVIDKHGLHASKSKVMAIQRAPVPQNISDLRSFLGLINYYRKFLPNLSEVLAPLNQLLHKGQGWKWSKTANSAFCKAKEFITSPTVLIHFDPSLPVILACDASSFGLGAVISHVLPDGSERPIAFASRSLSVTEKGYAQIDKEALGIIFGVKRFHQYLYGRNFTLYTDHQPLTRIFGRNSAIPTLAAARLQRWALILASYLYDIKYKSTKLHGNADGLSRAPLPWSESTKLDEEENPVDILLISQVELFPVDHKDIARETVRDPVLSKVLQFSKMGWPTSIDKNLHPYYNRRNEISIQQGCLIWGIRVIIPKKFHVRLLKELHIQHTGTVKMKMLARAYFWWSGLDEEIGNVTKSCAECMFHSNQPVKAPLHPWVWPTRPWQRLHIDFAGPFQGTNFLVIIDAHSKWPEVYPMTSTTADKTVEVIANIMARFGIPEHIVSDNGSQFISKEFKLFCQVHGIKHTRSAPYHPQTNGQAERFVQVLKRVLSKCSKEKPLLKRLNQLLFSYRTTPHVTTQETPAFLFLGRQIRTRLDLLRPSPGVLVHHSQDQQVIKREEKKNESKPLNIGQHVMARVFARKEKWKPAVIVKQTGPVSYEVKLESGIIWKRHRDHLNLTQIKTSESEDDNAHQLSDSDSSSPGSDRILRSRILSK